MQGMRWNTEVIMPLKIVTQFDDSIPLVEMREGQIGVLRGGSFDGQVVMRRWKYLFGVTGSTTVWNNVKWTHGESDESASPSAFGSWRVRILPPGTLLEVE